MQSSACFLTQEASNDILLRVTNVCAECYDDLHVGDTIHYDMQNYRYLCNRCQEAFCSHESDVCEVDDDVKSLF